MVPFKLIRTCFLNPNIFILVIKCELVNSCAGCLLELLTLESSSDFIVVTDFTKLQSRTIDQCNLGF